MFMGKTYQGRLKELSERLNKHLSKITGYNKDYFSNLKQEDLIELKTIVSNINNVLTLKATLSATEWICKFFGINDKYKNDIIQTIDETKSNANGYDINITTPQKIISEVKCTVPINDGNKYGSAQMSSILEDAIKLKKGKRSLPNTSEYIKLLFLLDLGKKTDEAISQMLKISTGSSDKSSSAERHKIKKDIVILDNSFKKDDLRLNKIYIKKIKI